MLDTKFCLELNMKEIVSIIFFSLLLFIAVIAILIKISSTSITKEKALRIIDDLIRKNFSTAKESTECQILIHSEKMGLQNLYSFKRLEAIEKSERGKIVAGDSETPFHIASVGKTFTAVLVMRLVEDKKFSLSDPIANYLERNILDGLFIYNGKNFQEDVTIEQLLGHTSGIADYFGDSAKNSQPIFHLILSEPDRFWTPQDLIAFTRDHQQAYSAPGGSYHYSDTGYILLGLLIEKVTGKSFDQNLAEKIFKPLAMRDSYLLFYSEPENIPAKALSPIWFHNREVTSYKSLSADWAGGGIVSTASDLLKFHKALNEGVLVSNESLSRMERFDNKFLMGIYYGLGMMQFRFEEFFPLLKGYPRMTGHMGVLSVQMFYDATNDLYLICNFGSDAHMQKSVQLIIQIVGTLKRIAV